MEVFQTRELQEFRTLTMLWACETHRIRYRECYHLALPLLHMHNTCMCAGVLRLYSSTRAAQSPQKAALWWRGWTLRVTEARSCWVTCGRGGGRNTRSCVFLRSATTSAFVTQRRGLSLTPSKDITIMLATRHTPPAVLRYSATGAAKNASRGRRGGGGVAVGHAVW